MRVACVQAESVVFDRAATIDKLAALAAGGSGRRREACALPRDVRARVPVEPLGARTSPTAASGAKLWARLAQESVTLPRASRSPRRRATPGSGSRSASTSSSAATIYNSLLLYSPDGTLALHHRKLVPTNHERLVWGQGDGRGLDVCRRTRGSPAG